MRVQRVLMPAGAEPGPSSTPAVARCPRWRGSWSHLQALDRSPTTVRTYATSLKLWVQFPGSATTGGPAGRRRSLVASTTPTPDAPPMACDRVGPARLVYPRGSAPKALAEVVLSEDSI